LSRFRHLFLRGKNKVLSRKIKNIFGFFPDQIYLYKKAVSHRSVGSNNNERLEMLGDAVLDSITVHYLYSMFPNKNEGFLSKNKSKITNRQKLNQLAMKIGLDELIILGNNADAHSYNIFGNAFEAIIGAIYLDKGYDFTKDIVVNRIYKNFLDIDNVISEDNDFKSIVISWAQKNKFEFEFVYANDESHNGIFEVALHLNKEEVAIGKGNSKKFAEQDAARKACIKLEIIKA
jgi:ribonuclease III